MEKASEKSTMITVGIITSIATICAALIGGVFLVINTMMNQSDRPNQPENSPPTTPTQYIPASTSTSSPIWLPGQEHPDYANVISSDTEGDWEPAPGYFWLNPDDENDFRVVSNRGNIEKVVVEYDVVENEHKGMKIHVNFTVDGLKEIRCHVVAYFYYADGQTIRANDTAYSTMDNQVSVGSEFIPNQVYFSDNDFSLFIPYDALSIKAGSGKVDLKFMVKLYNWRDEIFLDEWEEYFYISN